MEKRNKWYLCPRLWVELFVFANITGLAADIYLAHSTNYFRHPAEYVPLILSLAAPLLLLPALLFIQVWPRPGAWRVLGYTVGWAAVGVGVAGMIYHLDSRFFQERTLASLVYAAPFAAPLSYTGLGLLLILNRMLDSESVEWAMWVLLLALGGFVGNFFFSVTDHAQNGFYYWSEWIPVVSSALAVGFLTVPFVTQVSRPYMKLCAAVMILQALVGLLGFYFHAAADLEGPAPTLFDNIVFGAPVLAPLLFPDLVLLSFIGMWALMRHLTAEAQAPSEQPAIPQVDAPPSTPEISPAP
jgi:hypothetical protein